MHVQLVNMQLLCFGKYFPGLTCSCYAIKEEQLYKSIEKHTEFPVYIVLSLSWAY